MVKPTKLFWKAGKHVLRYLRGTLGYGLWYRHSDEVRLCGFTDADWEGSPTDRKKTSGGIFSIGSTGVSWYTQIDSYFTGLGFSKSEVDPNLYQIVVEGKFLIIVLYVDDLILTGYELLILSCKDDLAKEF